MLLNVGQLTIASAQPPPSYRHLATIANTPHAISRRSARPSSEIGGNGNGGYGQPNQLYDGGGAGGCTRSEGMASTAKPIPTMNTSKLIEPKNSAPCRYQ